MTWQEIEREYTPCPLCDGVGTLAGGAVPCGECDGVGFAGSES